MSPTDGATLGPLCLAIVQQPAPNQLLMRRSVASLPSVIDLAQKAGLVVNSLVLGTRDKADDVVCDIFGTGSLDVAHRLGMAPLEACSIPTFWRPLVCAAPGCTCPPCRLFCIVEPSTIH